MRAARRLAAALESSVDLDTVVAHLTSLTSKERGALVRCAPQISAPAAARLLYLLARVSGSPFQRSSGRAVLLDPAGPSTGTRAGGVIVNVADRVPSVDVVFAEALSSQLGPRTAPILALIATSIMAGARPSLSTFRRAIDRRACSVVDELERRGFLRDGDEGWRVVEPLPALARGALAESPVGAQATLAFAEALVAAEPSASDVHAAIAVLVSRSLGDEARLIAERFGARLLGSLDVSRLDDLASKVGALRPGSAFAYRLLESTGRHAALADLTADDRRSQRGDERALATVWAARAAWRLGRNLEAERLLGSLRRAPPNVRVEHALLSSALAQEGGHWARAEVWLDRATALAERARSPADVARCFHGKGTLASRRGQVDRASGAYLAALDALRSGPDHDRRLEGILVSNSATMRLWSGRLDDAERLYREAIELRSRAGTEREVVATKVAAARVVRARLGTSPATEATELARRAEALGDSRLGAEAWLDAAEACEQGGDHAAALAALDRARACEARMTGEDRILACLADAVSAKLHAWETGATRAAATLDRVADDLVSLGAPFYAARARRLAAGVLFAIDPRAAIDHLVAAHELAGAAGLVLGEEVAFLRIYARAVEDDDPRARAMGLEGLERVPPSEVHRALGSSRSVQVFARVASLRSADPSSGRVELVTSFGRKTVSAEEAASLRRGRAGVLVVDRERDALVMPDGSTRPLSRRPRFAALLFALASGGDQARGAADLVRAVWRTRDTKGARDALKVAVGRARAVVRPFGADVVPDRVAGSLAYRWVGPLDVVMLGSLP